MAPDVTRKRIFLETMERVYGGADKIIIDREAGQGVVPYLPLNELQPAAPGQSTPRRPNVAPARGGVQ
jgi:membrane protease subunit HflK